jgi:hypothetical protein
MNKTIWQAVTVAMLVPLLVGALACSGAMTTGNQNIEAWTIDPALKNLLGKHQDSKELQVFREQMGEAPEVEKFEKYKTSFQSWKSKGVSLSFDGKGILTCVFLYSENSDDYRAYKGALPGNLSNPKSLMIYGSRIPGRPQTGVWERE